MNSQINNSCQKVLIKLDKRNLNLKNKAKVFEIFLFFDSKNDDFFQIDKIDEL